MKEENIEERNSSYTLPLGEFPRPLGSGIHMLDSIN